MKVMNIIESFKDSLRSRAQRQHPIRFEAEDTLILVFVEGRLSKSAARTIHRELSWFFDLSETTVARVRGQAFAVPLLISAAEFRKSVAILADLGWTIIQPPASSPARLIVV
jgi:hypothetical protein